VVLETRPAIFCWISHHPGAQWVCLDVPEDDEQVQVILNDRALESTLPNMSRCLIPFVVSPRVRHCQRLDDTADRLAHLRPQQKVKVVGHQAVPEELERVALFGGGDGLDEDDVILLIGENGGAVVAAVNRVIDQTIIDGSR
jgi:hypothetical protein